MANIRDLPEELQEEAEKLLGEVPNTIFNDIQVLRKWIEEQPHLNALAWL